MMIRSHTASQWVSCKRYLNVTVWLLAALLCEPSVALTPPRPGEIEQYRQDGTLPERQARAEQLGNHRFDPQLVWNFRQTLATTQGQRLPNFAPPPDWRGGLPATGSPKTAVLLVDFPDCPHTGGTPLCPTAVDSTLEDVAAKFFGDGDVADAPYESLRNYYRRASYQTLTISGNVLGWYRASHNRSYYEGFKYDYQGVSYPYGTEVLMMEALNYYAGKGHNFAQYDNDNNGTLDAVYIKWTGPDTGWNGFWWAYQTSWWHNTSYAVSGKHVGKYVWSWIANPEYDGATSYHARTDIHETGHLLGLPDYYDYDTTKGPKGGVGGLDIMDSNWGDHNAFSKAMLGWLTPVVVNSGTQTRTLNPTGTVPDAVLVASGGTGSLFDDFFMAQYRKRSAGNDTDYPTDGMLIWHVNAGLKDDGSDFLNDNAYTAHKLLRLMEADGLETIETGGDKNSGGAADAGDFYTSAKTFTPSTRPNSNLYDKNSTSFTATVPSKISITDISGNSTATMKATFTATTATAQPDLVVTAVTSPASGTIGSNINVSTTVKNQGTATAAANRLTYFFSTDAIITTGDISSNGWGCNAPLLAGDVTWKCAGDIPVPTTLTPGTYYLGAYADSNGAVAESNETNNGRAAANTIVISKGTIGLPDFVVTTVTLNPNPPTANGAFSAEVTVKNQGTVAGDAGYLDVWANQAADQNCGSEGLWTDIGSLAAGATKTVTVSGLRSGGKGTKTLRAFIDSWCETIENEERNNYFTKTYTVK